MDCQFERSNFGGMIWLCFCQSLFAVVCSCCVFQFIFEIVKFSMIAMPEGRPCGFILMMNV